MSPAGTETQTVSLEYVVAEETPEVKPEKTKELSSSSEAQKRIEVQKGQALEVFRKTPKEIEEKFGLMVLERVFPELQIDDKYISFLLKDGQKDFDFKSNVTGESIPAGQISDHWILPRGEQISKSTGALYITEKIGKNTNLGNSFLSWEFNNLKNMIDSEESRPLNEQTVLKVAVKTDTGSETPHKRKMVPEDLFDQDEDTKEDSINKNGGLSEEDSVLEEIWEGKEMEDVVNEEVSPNQRVTQMSDPESITTLATGVIESPQRDFDSMGEGAFVVTEAKSKSELPAPIEGYGVSIKEKLHEQIGNLFPENDAARKNPDALLTKYPPVLISQDLIILSVKNKETGFEYFAYAKVPDEETPLEHKWVQNIFRKGDDVPLQMTRWLSHLEVKDDNGKYVKGFNTIALTV